MTTAPVSDPVGLGPRFPLRFTAATLAGWGIGIALVVALAQGCELVGLEGVQCITGIGVGAGVGWMQGRSVSRWVGGVRPWLLATTVGMGAPFVATDLVAAATGGEPALPVGVVLGALFAGLLQTRALRPHTPRALRWIAVSLAAWGVALTSVLLSGVVSQFVPSRGIALAAVLATWAVGGVLFGLVQGAGLARILRSGGAAAR